MPKPESGQTGTKKNARSGAGSITPVPIAQPPSPLPSGVRVPLYFTIQPGGAYLSSVSGTPAGARLYYPNSDNMPPGSRYNFWNYDPDPDAWGWYIYGGGTVDPTGLQVIPDPGVQVYELTGAMVASDSFAPLPGPPPDGGACDGDPVECSTGLVLQSHTDFFLPDVIPIQLTRTYRTLDGQTRQFGKGQTDNYDIFLIGDGGPITYPSWAAVVLPDGAWVYYHTTNSPGVLLCQENSGIFYNSVLAEDSNTNLWSLTLKNGTILTFPVSYNAQNSLQAALIRIEDRYGNQLLIYRNASGSKTAIVSPHGRTLTFSVVNPTTSVITDNFGRQVTYTYDANGNLSTVKDANGGVTTYSYQYNPTFVSFQLTSIKDARGNYPVSNLQYDACGRVSQETQADGGVWHFSYTPYSTSKPCYPIYQTTITDPRTYQKQLTFDTLGFLTNLVAAVGKPEQQTTTINRDETYGTHLISSITDQLGRTTSYGYDPAANITSVTRPGPSGAVTTQYTYEAPYSQLASVKDPLTHTWTINYDGLGSPTSIVDPLGHTTTLHLTSGLLDYVTDPLGNETQFFYNNYGDLHEIIDPAGNITYRNTDTAGRVTSIEDPLRNTTSFTYDNLDHLKLITDPNGGKTQFGYDANENLTSLIDAQWTANKTQYGYDAMNRRNSRTDALSKSESYQYDGNSNLTKYTDRSGHYVNYTYDGINRRTIANFQASTDVITYTWDGGDRLTQAASSNSQEGTIIRTPDLLDRLSKEVTSQGTVSYTYDNADRRQAMTVGGQTAVSYTFDNANRLTQISQSGTGTVGFTYDNADRRTLLTLPDAATQAYVYDNGGHGDSHVTSLTYKHSTTTIGNLTYTYDPDGRRSTVGGSLASVPIPRPASGNIFNADNEMTDFNGRALTYDADGQTLTDDSNTYTWETRRHLTNSHLTGISYGTDFVYDALGRRVKVTNEALGTTTQYLYDGLNPVQLTTGSSVTNVLTGLAIDEYFSFTNSTGAASLLTDVLGSTLALTDSTGAVFSNYYYEPFGKQPVGIGFSPSSPTITIPFEFTGREDDDGTNYYYRARYYNSHLQRFLSQDPIDFAGGDTNLYGYVRQSPSRFTDPSGTIVGADDIIEFLVAAGILAAEEAPAIEEDVVSGGKAVVAEAENLASGAGEGAVTPAAEAAVPATDAANEGIYEFTSASGKTYVGQSRNIAVRIQQHLVSGKLLPDDLATVNTTEVLGGQTAREIAEQLRINELGGVENLENVRNPIGPARRCLLPP